MPKMESRLRFWHQEETQDKTIFSNAFAAMLRVCPLRRARINWRAGRGVFNVSLAISPDFSAGRAKASQSGGVGAKFCVWSEQNGYKREKCLFPKYIFK